MSKVYPNLDYLSVENELHRTPSSNMETTNCGQIFSKGTALTRDIFEKLEDPRLGPQQTEICGHHFNTRQLWVITGLILLFLSSCLATTLMWCTDMFDGYVLSNLIISNTSVAYPLWKGPALRTMMKIYIFNYTNVDEYERRDVDRLHVTEVGPFVYEEISEKINVRFYPNGTISYQEKRHHKFRPDLSKGRRQSDRVIVPNMPLMGAASMSRNSFYMTRLAMSSLLRGLNAKPFLNVPAHRFIWGYDDNLYNLARGVLSFDKPIPFEKFGIMTSRNGTSEDVITIHSGEKDINKLGLVDRFNGEDRLEHWSTDECNKIQGGDGVIYPPYDIRQRKTVYMYHKELCRRVPLVYKKDVTMLNGKVPANRYSLPETVFDSPDHLPENQCYCDMESGNCAPQGLFNATPCYFKAPAFLSFPHFYHGDPAMREAVSGLKPDPKVHDSYIDIHPKFGFAMQGKNRLQMNVQVQKSVGMSQLDMFEDDVILPIAWFEFGMDEKDLPESAKDLIYKASFTAPAVEMSLKYGCLLTTLVTLTAILIILRGKWYDRIERLRRLQRNLSTQSGAQLVS